MAHKQNTSPYARHVECARHLWRGCRLSLECKDALHSYGLGADHIFMGLPLASGWRPCFRETLCVLKTALQISLYLVVVPFALFQSAAVSAEHLYPCVSPWPQY